MAEEKRSSELSPQGWLSQFSPRAWKHICYETTYLLILALLSLIWLAVLWWAPTWVGLEANSTAAKEFQQFALAFLAGILGGTAFAMKWLHHSVGLGPRRYDNKDGWSLDRRLWRLFVPILSGIMAGAFYAALQSGLLNLEIDTKNTSAFAVAFGFIVGYFSDRAAAKLGEVAYVLFGTTDEAKHEEPWTDEG